MANLILMRHAKSDWSQGTGDIDRPLNKRGRSGAKRMARHLAETATQPDRILCSPARRTRETLALLLPRMTALREILFIPSLYENMSADYLAIIRAYGADADSLMVVGHNSATHDTALTLATSNPGPDFPQLASAFPTAAVAIFTTDSYWSEIGPDNMTMQSYVLPRDLHDNSDA